VIYTLGSIPFAVEGFFQPDPLPWVLLYYILTCLRVGSVINVSFSCLSFISALKSSLNGPAGLTSWKHHLFYFEPIISRHICWISIEPHFLISVPADGQHFITVPVPTICLIAASEESCEACFQGSLTIEQIIVSHYSTLYWTSPLALCKIEVAQ